MLTQELDVGGAAAVLAETELLLDPELFLASDLDAVTPMDMLTTVVVDGPCTLAKSRKTQARNNRFLRNFKRKFGIDPDQLFDMANSGIRWVNLTKYAAVDVAIGRTKHASVTGFGKGVDTVTGREMASLCYLGDEVRQQFRQVCAHVHSRAAGVEPGHWPSYSPPTVAFAALLAGKPSPWDPVDGRGMN